MVKDNDHRLKRGKKKYLSAVAGVTLVCAIYSRSRPGSLLPKTEAGKNNLRVVAEDENAGENINFKEQETNAAVDDASVEAEPDDYDTSCCGEGQRDALPDTWRRYCLKGECIRVCKPWIDDGFFFKGEGGKYTWMNEIHKRGAPVLEKSVEHKMSASNLEFSIKDMDYISPSDGIRLCGVACQSKKEHQIKFATNFCSCGEFASEYFDVNPQAEDYSGANSASSTVDSEGPVFKAVLRPTESQPRC